ncbi:hypothetical protein TNCV_923281 [Trichonephila clavipes]|nr:hypothetical protein TNCV_923281 [Trichonephila clavipes]
MIGPLKRLGGSQVECRCVIGSHFVLIGNDALPRYHHDYPEGLGVWISRITPLNINPIENLWDVLGRCMSVRVPSHSLSQSRKSLYRRNENHFIERWLILSRKAWSLDANFEHEG